MDTLFWLDGDVVGPQLNLTRIGKEYKIQLIERSIKKMNVQLKIANNL